MNPLISGKEYLTDSWMPLVYSDTLVWPGASDGYYGLLFAEKGMIQVDDEAGKRNLPAPLVIFIKPGHTIREVHIPEGCIHSLVFRPEAVNTTISGADRTKGMPNLPEYFFYRPFTEITETGYSCETITPGLCGKITLLCKKLDANLNNRQGNLWPCMSRSFFLELLILLERNWFLLSAAPEFPLPDAGDGMESIFEYIHTEYGEALSLQSLAERFATNRTTLNQRFHKTCGMSAMVYLNSVRLEIAASLLRNTELTVSEIAGRTGFTDESYFSRAFRKKTGVPPGMYRKSFPDPYSAPV